MMFYCAFCHMVSGLVSGGLCGCGCGVWYRSIKRFKGLLRRFYGFYNNTLNAVKGLKMALVRSGMVSRCRLWSVWWCLCLWCGAVAVSVALLVVFWSLVLSGVGVVSSVALWVFWCAVVVSCCLWVWCWSSLVVFSSGVVSVIKDTKKSAT